MLISSALWFSDPILYRSQGKTSKYIKMPHASATLFLATYNLIKNVGYYLGNG